ncbi:MAG: ThuA domain-containing protein [Pirellulales bacterium]|nr:ThuA domain-containing protein [Pirellulales bacterium]
MSRNSLAWRLGLIVISLAPTLCRGDEARFRMPEYPDAPPPPPRSRAEVDALLAGDAASNPAPQNDDRPLRIVLVAGPKDHGQGEHDYPRWQQVWARHLPRVANTHVETAWEFPAAQQIDAADVLVFYQRGSWDDQRAAAIDPFLARGGGLVYIHWAVDGRGQQDEMAKRMGLSALGGSIKFRHGELNIDFSPAASHPVARNFQRVHWVDETYWQLAGDESQIDLIATSAEDGRPWPQFWTVQRGRGRVFVSIPGHYMWTFDDPAFRTLLFRGIAWAGRRPVDRFNELVRLDARLE